MLFPLNLLKSALFSGNITTAVKGNLYALVLKPPILGVSVVDFTSSNVCHGGNFDV